MSAIAPPIGNEFHFDFRWYLHGTPVLQQLWWPPPENLWNFRTGHQCGRSFCRSRTGRHRLRCDDRAGRGRRVAFTLLPHLQVKGARASILAFNPTAVVEDHYVPPRRTIIDRTSETALLRNCLGSLGTGGGKLIQILGEAGIGKS